MKTIAVFYWIFVGLTAALMLMASIPDVLQVPGAVAVITHLGYPTYLLPFIGIAKILGVIAILAPGFIRLKEWAYAGLAFDLIGALYSHLSSGDPPSVWAFAVTGMVLVGGSYLFFRTRLSYANPSKLSTLRTSNLNSIVNGNNVSADQHEFSRF